MRERKKRVKNFYLRLLFSFFLVCFIDSDCWSSIFFVSLRETQSKTLSKKEKKKRERNYEKKMEEKLCKN